LQKWEATEQTESPDIKIDEAKGVIYNVLILGNKAKNGRRYLLEAKEDAVQRGLYEQLQVYIGPHKRSMWAKRSPNNHAGELRNVHLTDNEEVRGDLHYNRASRGGRLVLEIAKRFPKAFGLSQHAWVNGYEQDGEKLITEIGEIAVADVVKDPGTTTNIFEDTNVDKDKADEAREDVDDGLDNAGGEPVATEEPTIGDCINDLISEIHGSDLTDDKKLAATKTLMKLKKDLGFGSDDGSDDTADEDAGEETGDDDGKEKPASEGKEEVTMEGIAKLIDKKLKAHGAAQIRLPRKNPPKSKPRSEVTEDVNKPKLEPKATANMTELETAYKDEDEEY